MTISQIQDETNVIHHQSKVFSLRSIKTMWLVVNTVTKRLNICERTKRASKTTNVTLSKNWVKTHHVVTVYVFHVHNLTNTVGGLRLGDI